MVAYPKPGNKNKNDREKIEDRLWFYLSQYIRLSKSSKNGWCKCISCNRILKWNSMDAGHFISSKWNATKYEEDNIEPQCRWCNRFRYLDPNLKPILIEDHKKGMIKKHGEEFVEDLELKSREFKRYSYFELEQLKDYYRLEVKKLKKEKDLSL